MNDYLIIHRHKYGTSHAIFTAADFDPRELKEDDAISLAKLCGLDFEPQKNEELEFLDFLELEHKNIKKGDLNG